MKAFTFIQQRFPKRALIMLAVTAIFASTSAFAQGRPLRGRDLQYHGTHAGRVIPRLSAGFYTVMVAGLTYFVLNDIYYRKVPAGYEAVAVPMPVADVTKGHGVVTAAGQVAVTIHLLNVRSGPGKTHGVIGTVQKGDRLAVMGQAPGWLYVKLPYGGFGWVSNQYTRSAGPKPLG
ncbi:MAG: SH3 domain-containing protein [Desulfobacterales bacterium]|nr:SH3 domain-containing protein [Desulfobacterales bacterium]MDD4073033.1 SH3 domain-containing protein [Desulfobacterales bacterium]MDD4392818.1 SH3 domain-containing protein [Desulfobacterales bacterium]